MLTVSTRNFIDKMLPISWPPCDALPSHMAKTRAWCAAAPAVALYALLQCVLALVVVSDAIGARDAHAVARAALQALSALTLLCAGAASARLAPLYALAACVSVAADGGVRVLASVSAFVQHSDALSGAPRVHVALTQIALCALFAPIRRSSTARTAAHAHAVAGLLARLVDTLFLRFQVAARPLAAAELLAALLAATLATLAALRVAAVCLSSRPGDAVRSARRVIGGFDVESAHVWRDVRGLVVALIAVRVRDAHAAHSLRTRLRAALSSLVDHVTVQTEYAND